MPIRVEVAASADADVLDGLNRLLPQLSSTAAPLTAAMLESMVTSEATTLLLAFEHEVLVGTLTLVVFPIPTGLRAWIEDVVVDESARRRGVGEALTVAAVDEARRRGARSIDLTSRPARVAANALYQRLGFRARDTNVFRYTLDS